MDMYGSNIETILGRGWMSVKNVCPVSSQRLVEKTLRCAHPQMKKFHWESTNSGLTVKFSTVI